VCFSAEASFAVGIPLIPAGTYCVWAAARKKPSYLGLAAVPIFFGIQQISEGFVWHALHHQDAAQIRAASLFFLFFALAFWPFWFPFLTTLMEPNSKRRWIFVALTALATSWFWVLYYPLVVGPESLLQTKETHHSIRYDYYPRSAEETSEPDQGSEGLAVYQYVPRPLLQALYLATIALPMLLSSQAWGRLPGLVLGASALLSAVVFHYAFVSVWCFFAAALSMYLCVVFYRLPRALHKTDEAPG